MLNLIISPFYKIAAVAAVVFTILATVYRKGQTSAVDSYVNKQNKEAEDAVQKATIARNRIDFTPVNRVRDNDGYRRD